MTNSYDVAHGLSQVHPGPEEPVEIAQQDDTLARTGNTARDQEMYVAGIRTGEENTKHNAAIRAGVPEGWKLLEALRESLLWTASSLAAVGKEQDLITLEGRKRTIGEILDEANAALNTSSPDCAAPGVSTVEDAQHTDACPRCGGTGNITVLSDNSPDAHDVEVCCDHCQGTGAAVDAAKYLAAALSGEKYRHMQIYGEFKNFHRSLCARFGYAHDDIHFRRDLVSLEEAIAAKVAAPAAGDAQDAARYRQLRKALTSYDTGWLDRIATALEAMGLDPDEDKLPTPEQVDGAFDAAQRKGDA
jgi:hypothetical protein